MFENAGTRTCEEVCVASEDEASSEFQSCSMYKCCTQYVYIVNEWDVLDENAVLT